MYPIRAAGTTLLRNYCSDDMVIPYAVEIGDAIYELTKAEYAAVQSADGLHPLHVVCARPGKSMRWLRKIGALQTKRLVRGWLINTFTLIPVGSRAEAWRPVAGWCSRLQPVFSILLILLGVLTAWMMPLQYAERTGVLGFMLEHLYLQATLHVVIAMIAHEFGHFAAAVSSGYEVRDVGLLLLGIMPVGAYVSCTVPRNALRRQRFRLYVSGCEANLMLTGLWLMLAHLVPGFGMVGLMGVIVNGSLCMFNMLPAYGLDGAHALATLLDVPNLTAFAWTQLFIPEERTVRNPLALVGCLLILLSNVVAWGVSILGLISPFLA